ncbi:hypothetical protein HY632_05155 [Candidatus Uhrbacteria bacterium]|nr:hypothetical protein [Candidatus Uhrbacteria bacterium]
MWKEVLYLIRAGVIDGLHEVEAKRYWKRWDLLRMGGMVALVAWPLHFVCIVIMAKWGTASWALQALLPIPYILSYVAASCATALWAYLALPKIFLRLLGEWPSPPPPRNVS